MHLVSDRYLRAGRFPAPTRGPARLALSGLLLAVFAGDAAAALSRWSASNNRIYVYGGGSMTLTDISAGTPSLPAEALQRVDASAGVWQLNANIIVENETTLLLSGDVKELRLKSNPSSTPATDVTNFVSITAGNYDVGSETAGAGTVRVDGVKVTSWDTNANAPDSNTADGRAYLRARSAMLGTPRISRMDILNSEVQYLGYEASERYGLSWKANGDLAVVHVLGDVKNSKIHHNHYGVYSFGLKDGQWTGNHVHDNDGYGFDAHDESNNLVIDDNIVERNGLVDPKGKHGIILSERCLNAKITNNTSSANGGNGIMLHDFADNALIENNTTNNNLDAGVAIFCSSGAIVKNNTMSNNAKYGIRLTVASRDNQIEGNQILNNGTQGDTTSGYGIFMQPATDSNGICGDLTPRNNTFTNNTVSGSATAGVKITNATHNAFVGNTFADGISIRNSASTTEQLVTFHDNTFNSGTVVRLDGAANMPLRAEFSKTPRVSLEVDTGSVVNFTDDDGAIFDLTRDLMVAVNGTISMLALDSTNAGAEFVVDTRPLFVQTDGSLVEVAPTQWNTSGDRTKGWIARAESAAGTVQYRVGDLETGVAYDVKRTDPSSSQTTTIGSFVAGDGSISFSDAPATTTTQTYAVTRSATQPQTGGGGGGGDGGGGGGGGALNLMLLAALGSLLAVRRKAARIS